MENKENIDKMLDNMDHGRPDKELMGRFLNEFSPFTLPGFKMPRRFTGDEPIAEGENEGLQRSIMRSLDEQLEKDPYICIKFLCTEITNRLLNTLKGEDGSVNAAALFAILGAAGGHEIMRGIVSSLKDFTSDELTRLGVMIVETNSGSQYLMGDLVGNQFFSFYMTVGQDNSLSTEHLLNISRYCAENIGSPAYWESPFSGSLPIDAKTLGETFAAQFSGLLDTYTRYPLERSMAYSFAAAELIRKAGGAFPKEKALEILAEYGWRTSHFIA